ncbi:MAG TPA: DNA translocase FtsK [Candidatus Limnocylindrales bacterium]|nr:DNA translocase FtsK [Candidatus Limnocylindrales bacterium]
MTGRRRAAPRRTPSRSAPRRRGGGGNLNVNPEVVRSVVGIAILVVGLVTLIALLLPGKGQLTDLWRNLIAPWFGTGRWLLPPILIVAGLFVQRARGDGGRWGLALLGAAVSYVGFLGALDGPNIANGGRIGRFVGDGLAGLITHPGSFVVCLALGIIGLLLALDMSLPTLLKPLGRGARTVGAALTAPAAEDDDPPAAPIARRVRRDAPTSLAAEPADEPEDDHLDRRSGTRATSPAQMSQTIWAGRGDGRDGGPGPISGPPAGGNGSEGAPARASVAVPTLEPVETVESVPWVLPSTAILEIRPPGKTGGGMDHAENIRDIEEKLRSFGIDARVVGTNTGPVVTQYEVRPEKNVKLSRIEGLQDDLAMALAARSIRIEAPIPGKDVVGIEIPNHKREVVGFRSLIEDADMLAATSRLTFALGRDVSGQPYAVDLAKMPHLLVAGATGSGKSVCVNALITSLLMHSRPDEVRLILVDLKRVELAPYDALPHLLQHVIVEPHEAKAALNWAVHEMEDRYKRLASHTVRNIAAYNDKVGPEDRMPFVVLIIDELADLIMREGRKVEDPIVKIAQKARAVGIHLVLATQRPSVNVVTGLIKANVPSRIAFAMASNVDSRTVLDQPGAEDLIGRGDMLYQPVDLPRPVRLQGVFVSDKEVSAVTEHWRKQAAGPFYDDSIFAFVDGDENGSGQFGWLAKMADDDMVVKAAELVTSTGRASTSSLQTKLKVGFSRASRLMDELERYGIIGPQDPRNPASPRLVYGSDNWLTSLADVDDPGD